MPKPSARLSRRQLIAWVLVLVGVPTLAFGLPAALGLPWLVGDNLIQNFPLRALVGTDLRAGHLPLWDPYIWSGSPLLAGFNAGAAYPLSWLFAMIGDVPAWVVGQVAAVVVAASGMMTLLRFQGRSRLAAGVGAAAYSFGGFVAAQNVHIDVVEAAGWLAWAFVALDRIAKARSGRSVLGWVALLGVSLGLMVLTGAAEPILDGGVALVLYALWTLWRAKGRRARIAVALVGGVVLGALVGAAQLLPGSLLQTQSQRGMYSYWYFGSGSMNKSLTVLLLDPLLLGGAHNFPLSYAGTYNLVEISGYVGIMAMMGAVGLLAKRHRRSPEAAQWWIWYLIAALGVLLVWGAFTPLGHLEYLIPFYNRQRLLARNWLEVDLALVVLFAAWVDHMLLSPGPPSSGAGRSPPLWRRWPSDVVLPLLPVGGVLLLQVLLAAGGAWFPHFMHVPQPVSYGALWRQDVFLCVPSAIAVAAGWTVVNRRRLGHHVGKVVVAVVAADLALFNVAVQTFPQPGTAVTHSVPADTLAGLVASAPRGPGGTPPRFALYDPDRYYSPKVEAIGQPDLNIVRRLRSVQGYGALVSAGYENATATHMQGNLDARALGGGTFAGLDLGVLVVPPQYFVSLVVAPPGVRATLPGTVGPTPAATPLPPLPPDRRAPATSLQAPPTSPANYSAFLPPAAALRLSPGTPRTWYFGTVLAVRAIDLTDQGAARLRVGLIGPGGTGVRWLVGPAGATGDGLTLVVTAPGAPSSSGLVVEQVSSGDAGEVGPAVVTTAGQGTYRLDGGLRDTVTWPTWRFLGALDDLGVFEETPSGSAVLDPAGAGTTRVLSAPPWGTAAIEVRTRVPALLVWDEAYASGWQATVEPAGAGPGTGFATPVLRHGLLQAVRVPAGAHVVSFRYRPHRLVEGLVGSAVGVLVAAGLLIWARLGRRTAPGPGRRGPGARRAAARSAGAPGDAAPAPVPSAPAPPRAGPPPRGP